MDFIKQFWVFVEVLENGSFSRAAKALRFGRPGVTNAVNELEDEHRRAAAPADNTFYDVAASAAISGHVKPE